MHLCSGQLLLVGLMAAVASLLSGLTAGADWIISLRRVVNWLEACCCWLLVATLDAASSTAHSILSSSFALCLASFTKASSLAATKTELIWQSVRVTMHCCSCNRCWSWNYLYWLAVVAATAAAKARCARRFPHAFFTDFCRKFCQQSVLWVIFSFAYLVLGSPPISWILLRLQ